MAEPRFWVFDLDDTLYAEADYVRSAFACAGDLVARLYGVQHAAARLMAMKQAGQADPIAALWAEAGLPSAGRAGVIAAMRAHVPDIRLRPGAKDVLDRLRKSGRGFGVMTDGRSVTQRAKLAALQCLDAGLIMISQESGFEKPDARCYQAFEAHAPGARFGYVGDNPRKDFVGAHAAGWETVMLADDGGHIHRQDQDYPAGHFARFTAACWAEIGEVIDGCA